MFNLEIKNKIKEHALNFKEEEVCGLIVLNNKKYEVYPCLNISNNKKNHFILDPISYINASDNGDIVALYHSHKKYEPSITDNFISFQHNIFSIIYCKDTDKFYIIEPKLEEYLDIDFLIGKNDCLSLVENYYNKELNIKIPYFSREDGWFNKNGAVIFDNINNAGFFEIEPKNMKKNDLLFFGEDKKYINHIGIYLGNNLMLHHPRNTKSVIENLNEHYLNRLKNIVRHINYKNE
jgi:proteasome lid subunit RPN8/RPN11